MEAQQNEMTAGEAAECLEFLKSYIPEESDKFIESALEYAASILRRVASGELAEAVHANLIPEYIEKQIDEHDYFGNYLYTKKVKKLIGYRCSNCGAWCTEKQKYCTCGALMGESDMCQTQGGKDDSHADD